MIDCLTIPEGNPMKNMVLSLAQLGFQERRMMLNRFRSLCCREFIVELRK